MGRLSRISIHGLWDDFLGKGGSSLRQPNGMFLAACHRLETRLRALRSTVREDRARRYGATCAPVDRVEGPLHVAVRALLGPRKAASWPCSHTTDFLPSFKQRKSSSAKAAASMPDTGNNLTRTHIRHHRSRSAPEAAQPMSNRGRRQRSADSRPAVLLFTSGRLVLD
jgi:hypothetical protein